MVSETNSTNRKKEYLIIGAGLSGICMGIQLINSGNNVTLVDSGENYSTIVAAGQINPLVFRRMTKSWRVDDFLPFAEDFYKQLEKESRLPIYFPIPIRRIFSSAHERVMWMEKQEREGFSQYMEKITEEDDLYDLAQNDFGSGRIKKSCFIHAVHFLEAGKKWIEEKGKLIQGKINYTDMDPEFGVYDNKVYDSILFCEGSHNINNPWFGNMPVEHTKGEVLTLVSDEMPEHESLNRKCFLLPIGNKTFRLGATYEWNTPNTELTQVGKEDLLDKLNLLSKKSYEIVEHQAGIRPTTPDRRPIVGRHPEFSKLLIFNGLGTKGYLIAPRLAKEFVDFLEGKGELDREVRIERIYR